MHPSTAPDGRHGGNERLKQSRRSICLFFAAFTPCSLSRWRHRTEQNGQKILIDEKNIFCDALATPRLTQAEVKEF